MHYSEHNPIGPLPNCESCGVEFDPEDDYVDGLWVPSCDELCPGCVRMGECVRCGTFPAETLILLETGGSKTRLGCFCPSCRAKVLAQDELTEKDTVEL